jgi:hypothetical protein
LQICDKGNLNSKHMKTKQLHCRYVSSYVIVCHR